MASTSASPNFKKAKTAGYILEKDIEKLINNDKLNVKVWDGCKKLLEEGKSKFLSSIEEEFCCICCQDLVCKPITTPCAHNVCFTCLQRSFKAEVYSCPACRFELGEKYEMKVNENLSDTLIKLFPGYNSGR